MAEAEQQPHPQRCSLLYCNEIAIGETSTGVFCARHLAECRRADAEMAERRRYAAELDSVVWTFGDEDAEPVAVEALS